MNVCATTDKHESTMFDLYTSNTKSGFLITLTQNLSGRLQKSNANKSYSLVSLGQADSIK